MSLVTSTFYLLSPYADTRERSVAQFFRGLTEHSKQSTTRRKLEGLLQNNIAVLNLWSEYRYKGYKYLNKSKRKKLYGNLQRIEDDFNHFYIGNKRSAESILGHIHALSPKAHVDAEKVVLLQALIDYFSPRRGTYEYRDSSSFGRLLRNPSEEKLIGDCNQIVTLYIYLYSRYYDVRDLQVRVLPNHVALHYGGIDIEATTAAFTNYDDQKSAVVLPIYEIVSINLLDVTDSYLSTHEVAAEDFLQASRFAFILSHDHTIARRNLDAAYGRLISQLMEHHNYQKALNFAKASKDIALLSVVGHNGAVYEMEHGNYAAARRFAEYASKRENLIRSSWHAEGVRHYDAHRYHDAIKAFKRIDDSSLVRKCYEGLFFDEQKKMPASLTTESIKRYSGVIKHMSIYAKKSGNKKLIEHAERVKKFLTDHS